MENQTPQIQPALLTLNYSHLTQDQQIQILRMQLESVKAKMEKIENERKILILTHKSSSILSQKKELLEKIQLISKQYDQLAEIRMKLATIIFFTPNGKNNNTAIK
jgi:hypothetical protein